MSADEGDRVAVVTGATSEVGLAAVRALVDRGVRIVAVGRDEERLASAARTHEELLHPLRVDLESADAWETIVGVAEGLGTPGVFVSAAAVLLRGPFHETAAADWEHAVNVNLHSVVRGLQALVPGMVACGYGRVIAVSSVGSQIGLAHRALYTSTKAATEGLIRSLAVEYGGSGVTFNSIRPGALATEGTTRWLEANPELARATLDQIPESRLGEPAELTDCFGLLLDSAYLQGSAITVDGGWSIS